MDRQRLLIVGAGGFLGMHAVEAASASMDVICAGRGLDADGEGHRGNFKGVDAVSLDIAEASSVDRAFRMVRPDAVLLLAAISDIDRCEQNPDQAFAVNARGAEHVANACARGGIRLLFTSSAAVFDGSKKGYCEEDSPAPLSVYGRTKLWGEMAVRGLMPTAVILRFALVLGFAQRAGTNAMLDAAMAKWRAGIPVSFPTYEDRNPIDAVALSMAMIALIGNSALSGIYHAGSSDSVSRYELGLRLASRAGFSTDLVRPVKEPVPGRAPRGRHHFLLTDKLSNDCGLGTLSTDQVIERCFA
jgi:dTDP-4-dehydrorhamnose reductase